MYVYSGEFMYILVFIYVYSGESRESNFCYIDDGSYMFSDKFSCPWHSIYLTNLISFLINVMDKTMKELARRCRNILNKIIMHRKWE